MNKHTNKSCPTHYFVTGTDTGVGKTFVSTLLSSVFSYKYWKPIQCGVSPYTDEEFVSQFVNINNIIPSTYIFKTPTAPYNASKAESKQIEIDIILELYKKTNQPTIIEGAGGVMVPISPKFYMSDLMLVFNCPIILVARTSIGTINHTLLSLHHLLNKNLKVHAIVFSGEYEENSIKTISSNFPNIMIFHLPIIKTTNLLEIDFHFIKQKLKGIINEL